jgi:hypothetical protein
MPTKRALLQSTLAQRKEDSSLQCLSNKSTFLEDSGPVHFLNF